MERVSDDFALADAFVDRSVEDVEPRGDAHAVLQAALHAALVKARTAHPGLGVDEVALCRHLGAQLEQVDPRTPLADLRVEDAYLAFAAGHGDKAGVARMREIFGGDVDRALRKAASTGHAADELAQQAWVKLLAGGPDGEPHLLRYGGRGSLQGWVRVVTSRMAVDLLRRKGTKREVAVAPEVLVEIGRDDPDPQVQLLRSKYRDEVKAAMEDAFERLAPRDRRLLRGQLVEHLTVDDLGAMFGVHRTTASRWLHKARGRLVEGAHAALRERVGGGDETVRSLVQLVRSQLDLSVARLLQSRAGDQG